MVRACLDIVRMLLVGAFVTTVIAWGSTLFVDIQTTGNAFTRVSDRRGPIWGELQVWEGFATRIYEMPKLLYREGIDYPSRYFADGTVPQGLPVLSAQSSHLGLINETRFVLVMQFRGWPMPAFRGPLLWSDIGPDGVSAGRPAPVLRTSRCLAPHGIADFTLCTLPVEPLWRGFVIDTLVFGAIAWLVSRGPARLRRWVRRRRGQCLRCGYLRGSSPQCSECGAMFAQ